MVPGALGIIVVGYAESVAIAKSYAAQYNYQIDPNQELIAYGAASIGAGAAAGLYAHRQPVEVGRGSRSGR